MMNDCKNREIKVYLKKNLAKRARILKSEIYEKHKCQGLLR